MKRFKNCFAVSILITGTSLVCAALSGEPIMMLRGIIGSIGFLALSSAIILITEKT